MISRAKAFSAASFVVLMLTAAFSPTAMAAEFHSENSTASLKGSQEGTDVFTTTAGTVECKKVTYTGEISFKTSAWLSIAPTYSECTAFGFANATVNTHGCKFEYTNVNTVTFQCAELVTITASLFGTTKCTVNIWISSSSGVTYTNVGSGTTREMTIDTSVTSMSYDEEAGTGFGACSSTVLPKHDGKYSGKTLVTGQNASFNHVGIWYE